LLSFQRIRVFSITEFNFFATFLILKRALREEEIMQKIKNRKGELGFSLAELMIVIAIMGLIIAVSTYAWTATISGANEVAAIGYVDKISKAQAQFAARNQGKYAQNLDELIADGLLDQKFAGEKPIVNGYIFEVKAANSSEKTLPKYAVYASPEVDSGISATGTRSFYLDPNLSAIRFTKEKRPAKPDDSSV
jgi:prepilin-type N-terminal cleavage/methylation domain-containing protein